MDAVSSIRSSAPPKADRPTPLLIQKQKAEAEVKQKETPAKPPESSGRGQKLDITV